MIDWEQTRAKYGYGSLDELKGRYRPEVIVTCSKCGKQSTIKLRIKQDKHWTCCSCVGLNRSTIISETMTKTWADTTYKNKQVTTKNDPAYKFKMSENIKKKWEQREYRDLLATGIDINQFLSRSSTTFGSKFDYTDTEFLTWNDKITVKCNTCLFAFRCMPQKHLEYGYCPKCGISSGHKQILQYLDEHNISYEVNDRTILRDLELDIYIPDHKLAIEYHGLYWHSYDRLENRAERTRHQNKSLRCLELGLDVFQIFDFEWLSKTQIVKSMISNKLRKSIKINARQCAVERIDDKEASTFFDLNHLYGHRTAAHYYALKHQGEILAATSFSRYKNGYELIRLASKCGHTIRGGFSKLLSSFFKDVGKIDLYTYSDLRYSKGSTYSNVGFEFIKVTDPGYFYYNQNKDGIEILSRHQCQKGKLHKLLADYDFNLSESANMFNNGYRRVWDAGHKLFKLPT